MPNLARNNYIKTSSKDSLHEVTNNNGLRSVQYATINNFKVLSTWYPKKVFIKELGKCLAQTVLTKLII
jgi:hypothetical protein